VAVEQVSAPGAEAAMGTAPGGAVKEVEVRELTGLHEEPQWGPLLEER